MRVKICGIKDNTDFENAISAEPDAMGFLVGQRHKSSDFILPGTAARFAEKIPPYISPVLVTHLTDPEAVCDIVLRSQINTVQLHGGSSLDEVKKLRDISKMSLKLIFAAHIIDDECVPSPEDFYSEIDALLLDSYNKSSGEVGGTGTPHNWNVSSEIVNTCPLPVILAGGLNPDNIEDAVNTVLPYGVDANSGLRGVDSHHSARKCRDFINNARFAAAELTD